MEDNQADAKFLRINTAQPLFLCNKLWLVCVLLLIQGFSFAHAQSVVSDSVYKLRNQCSGKLLDVSGASQLDSAPLIQWAENGGLNQQFKLQATSNGFYQLAAQHSQKVVDVRGGNTGDGTTVQQYASNGTNAQQWKLIDVGGGYYKLESRVQAGKVLDVSGASTADGARVQLWTDNGTCAQKWRFEQIVTSAAAVFDEFGIQLRVPGDPKPIPSNAYVVAPNGNDANDGITQPWKTFEHAVQHAPGGSTIVFRAGTYRVAQGQNIWGRLTLRAAPGEEVWIKGSQIVAGWTPDGNAWRKDNWTASFPNTLGPEWFVDPNNRVAGYRDMVYVNGRALTQVLRREDVGAKKFYVDAQNQKLYIGDNPNGHTIEATVAEKALGMFLGNTNASNSIVSGLGFAHFADRAIEIAVPRVRLENNAFVWNGLNGATIYGESGNIGQTTRNGVSTDDVVTGNLFGCNGGTGLGGSKAHRLLVENNRFFQNNQAGFSTSWDASGFKFIATDDLLFKNNIVSDNHGNGVWLDVGMNRSIVINNTFEHNGGNGIWVEISKNALVASNLIVSNASHGVYLTNSAGNRIYNNTLVNNGKPIRVDEQNRPPNNGPCPGEEYCGQNIAEPNWIAGGNVIINNLLVNALGTGAPTDVDALFDVWFFLERPTSRPPLVAALNYNAYVRTVAGQPILLARWANPAAQQNVYATLADLRSSRGFEQHGRALDNTSLSNIFVDSNNHNYQLVSGSSLRGAGEILPPDIADILGVPAGQAVNIGIISR